MMIANAIRLVAALFVVWRIVPDVAETHAARPGALREFLSVAFEPQLLRLNYGIFALHAVLMALFMLSLAGMPPTAGFIGKLYLFKAMLAVTPELAMPWLVVVGVLTSVVSFYYYLRPVTNMFMRPPGPGEAETAYAGRGHLGLALGISAAGTLILGILPNLVLPLAIRAAEAIQNAPL